MNEAIVLNPKIKGIIAILISAIGFSFMSVFFRLSGDLPVFQKSLARNLVAMFIPLFFIFKYKQPMFGKLSSQPLLISRSTLGLIGVLLNIYALDHMVLSDADTLMKLNPFWTILLCFIFYMKSTKISNFSNDRCNTRYVTYCKTRIFFFVYTSINWTTFRYICCISIYLCPCFKY